MESPRRLLAPLSWLYGAAITARNVLYDSGILRTHRAGIPVISVGNITAGGTGKTPLVEAIVGTLQGAGVRSAVLSRGYRRASSGTLTVSDGAAVLADADAAGDEPAQIARKHPGCVVVVDEDRARGAKFIESAFRPGAIVLDDGFQHRALRRDLDIVVLGPGREPLLPAGNGREYESSLRRADFVVLAGGREKLPEPAERKPFARMLYEIEKFEGAVPGTTVDPRDLISGRFVAFCGIGNPGSFRGTLAARGLEPAAFIDFPDHWRYDRDDLDRIAGAQRSAGAAYVVTTEKDSVRLSGRSMPPVPFADALVTVVVRAVIAGGREALDSAVLLAAGVPSR